MILFSSNKLEHALAAGSLSSWDKAKYLIFIILLYSFSGPIYVLTPSFGPKPPMWHSLLSLVSTTLVIGLTYVGAKKCYLTNKATDDIDFSGRFAALFVPMTFKFIAAMLPIMVIGAIIAFSTSSDKELRMNVFVYFLYSMIPIGTYLFYNFLNRSFKRLGILINEIKIPNNAIETDRE